MGTRKQHAAAVLTGARHVHEIFSSVRNAVGAGLCGHAQKELTRLAQQQGSTTRDYVWAGERLASKAVHSAWEGAAGVLRDANDLVERACPRHLR